MRYLLPLLIPLLLLCSCGPTGKSRAEIEKGPMKHSRLIAHATQQGPGGYEIYQYFSAWDEFDVDLNNWRRINSVTTYVFKDGKCADWTWVDQKTLAINNPNLPSFGGH